MATLAPPPPVVPVKPSRPAALRMGEAEYERWSADHDLVEWVAGEVVEKMSEGADQDGLRNWLTAVLGIFVRRRQLGSVHGPEFTMRLPQRPSRRNPDILFVAAANAGRLRPTDLDGAADLAIEVVSPDSVARDYRTKYLEYQAADVPEYWIADPLSQNLEPYRLDAAGAYEPIAPDADGRVQSVIVPGFWLRPADLWADPRPDELAVLAELGVA